MAGENRHPDLGLSLQPSGNPYASLAALNDDSEEPTMPLAEALKRPFRKVTATPNEKAHHQGQLFWDANPAFHTSENPYAILSSLDDDDDEAGGIPRASEIPIGPIRPVTFKEFLSKVDFRSECIRIFLPYVPPHLPPRISRHQRDFIARNERRSGKARYRLAEALRRYDLFTTVGISPQFNREHSQELSEQKLREIEALVSDD